MGQVSLADDGIWQHDDGAIPVQCRVVKLSQLVIIVRESRHRVVLPDRQRGSPHNTSTHGAETGSPELLTAWRGLAAQGSVGQETRGGVGRREQEEHEEVGMRVVVEKRRDDVASRETPLLCIKV